MQGTCPQRDGRNGSHEMSAECDVAVMSQLREWAEGGNNYERWRCIGRAVKALRSFTNVEISGISDAS